VKIGSFKEEKIAEISRFAFQILYWLTDNALLTKELCALGSLAHDEQVTSEIKQIMQEVHTFAEKAKDYYNQHVTGRDGDGTKTVFEFVLPLFNKCFKSHGKRLKKLRVNNFFRAIETNSN